MSVGFALVGSLSVRANAPADQPAFTSQEPCSVASAPAGNQDALPPIAIESVGVHGTTAYAVEIRNAGETPVDLSGFDFVFGSGESGTSLTNGRGFKLARGSLTLGPGEIAIVITHHAIKPNDRARSLYNNVYLALHPEGTAAILGNDELHVVTNDGRFIPNPGPVSSDAFGFCCDQVGPPSPCNEVNCENPPECWTNVTRATCATVSGCCWLQGCDLEECIGNCTAPGCSGTWVKP